LGAREWQSNIIHTKIYPNPFTTQFSIQLQTQSTETVTITIYGTDGKPVSHREQKLVSGHNDINVDDVSDLTPGLYLVSIEGTLSMPVRKSLLKIE
jgi:hypothetical protein